MEQDKKPWPNKATLWPNDKKETDRHPDIKGNLYVERGLLSLLMEKYSTPDGLVQVAISGWYININGKKCVSLNAGEPYISKPKTAPPPPPPPEDDEDMPF